MHSETGSSGGGGGGRESGFVHTVTGVRVGLCSGGRASGFDYAMAGVHAVVNTQWWGLISLEYHALV